jgi:hypothetical protein
MLTLHLYPMLMEMSKSWMGWACFLWNLLVSVVQYSKPILSHLCARSSESEVRQGGAMDIEPRVGSTVVLSAIGEEAVELRADSPMENNRSFGHLSSHKKRSCWNEFVQFRIHLEENTNASSWP